jgi:hypothetical protein
MRRWSRSCCTSPSNVALNTLTNYANEVAQTVVDFPTVEALVA